MAATPYLGLLFFMPTNKKAQGKIFPYANKNMGNYFILQN